MSQKLLKIHDGRSGFWQWDRGQKFIILSDSVTEIHLSHKGVKGLKELEIENEDNMRVCYIPDVFLQIPKNLIVYVMHATLKSEHTITSIEISVKQRPQPDGYISVHDDEYDDIDGRIDALEQIIESNVSSEEMELYVNNAISQIPTPDVSLQISEHNMSSSAHNDVRLLIKDMSDKLNTFLNSDDKTLDELSEIVEYIKNNKSLIDSITTSKVNVNDIINNLVTDDTNKPLSAAQGMVLNNSKLDKLELTNVINKALKLAKESGEFDGTDGVGIEKAEINADGVLVINYSNGMSKILGRVIGEPGKDGVSATHSWDGTVLTVTSASGSSSVDLKGEQGNDGKSPVKGVDYWTFDDKAEIIDSVIAAIPADEEKSQVQIITWEADD